jgi:hypothetical protein
MTERDWEAVARARVERHIEAVSVRLHRLAETVQTEGRYGVENGSYVLAAARIVHEVTWGVANLSLSTLIGAANDAESARAEKQAAIAERTSATAQADRLAGAVKMVVAMQEMAKGWAEQCAEEDKAREKLDPKSAHEQEFRLSDILTMINDAAREVGVEVES